MANTDKIDVKIPFEESGGSLSTVTGNQLASQRIMIGYSTTPGDIVHRPDWGANLEDYANSKPTPVVIQRLKNQARRFLATLPFLEEYEVAVTPSPDGATIETKARTDEGELLIPEVTI